MIQTRFKVSEEEYKFMQKVRNLKEKGFTDEDILQLDRSKELSKENMQKQRLSDIEMNKLRLTQFKRAIEFKEKEVKTGNSLEKHEEYVDNVKPIFVIKNDIDIIHNQIKQTEKVIKAQQEEYDKEK